MTKVVVGIDAGGTNVRVIVADQHGNRLGVGTAAGANPVSRGLPAAVEQLDQALGQALSDVDAGRIEAIAIGMAGVIGIDDGISDALAELAARRQIRARWLQLSDLEVAFAAGSAEPDGLVVLSGTGASVAEIRSGVMTRYLDAAGWLLGDIGSAYWLGRQACRAAIADRERRGPATVLTGRLARQLGVRCSTGHLPGADPDTKMFVQRLYEREPVRLAEFAPLVSAAAAERDPVAVSLIDEAAQALLHQAGLLLQDAHEVSSIVLAGSVLLADGPLRQAVTSGLSKYGMRLGEARNGAGGAACRALHALDVSVDPTVHGRLTAT